MEEEIHEIDQTKVKEEILGLLGKVKEWKFREIFDILNEVEDIYSESYCRKVAENRNIFEREEEAILMETQEVYYSKWDRPEKQTTFDMPATAYNGSTVFIENPNSTPTMKGITKIAKEKAKEDEEAFNKIKKEIK